MKIQDFLRNDLVGHGAAGSFEYGTVLKTEGRGGFEWVIVKHSWGSVGVLIKEIEYYKSRGY